MKYASLYHRLVANSEWSEAVDSCWTWTAKRDRWGYGRLNVYVPGLGATVTAQAHLALWVWAHGGVMSVDEWWLAYLELRYSGLEIDHLCKNTACISPGHLEEVTPKENTRRRDEVYCP